MASDRMQNLHLFEAGSVFPGSSGAGSCVENKGQGLTPLSSIFVFFWEGGDQRDCSSF